MHLEQEMTKRSEITKELSRRIEQKISNNYDVRTYWAKEVTFDYGTMHPVRVDYMLFKPLNNSTSGIEKGDFFAYEVKSSVEDYNSGHGLNYVGDYNYLVMPEDVYYKLKDVIGWKIGVYVPDNDDGLKMVQKAQRVSRERSCSQMLLMMFRSAQRERLKEIRGKKICKS